MSKKRRQVDLTQVFLHVVLGRPRGLQSLDNLFIVVHKTLLLPHFLFDDNLFSLQFCLWPIGNVAILIITSTVHIDDVIDIGIHIILLMFHTMKVSIFLTYSEPLRSSKSPNSI